MKAALLLLTLIIATAARAAIGDWRIHMAYSEPQQIERVGEQLFVRASNSLYLYNKTDQSLQTFDKTTGLNDVTITNIGWNQTAKRLVIVYDNSNIDLLDLQGNVTNISDLYNKTMTDDKTINDITMSGPYAYLATNFGGIKLDVSKAEISESYILEIQVTTIGIDNAFIYARTAQNQTYKAQLSSNLIDKSSWTQTNSFPQDIFTKDNSAYEQNISLVKTLQPGGPRYNYFGFMKLIDGNLYTCNGPDFDKIQQACIQVYGQDNEWLVYPSDGISEKTGQKYENLICLDVKDNKLFAGGRNGLYEFSNSTFTKFHNHRNSPIEPFKTGEYEYELTTGVLFDNSGNLWVTNSQAPSQSLLRLMANGDWKSHDKKEKQENKYDTSSLGKMMNLMFDSRGLLWFVNNNWQKPAVICYDTENDDVIHAITSFVNQDGTSITTYGIQSIAEDNEHNIWIGSDNGLLVIRSQNIGNVNPQIEQIKVPRNDGSNLADYLLANTSITAIAIDGGNRKWIGTKDGGVFLISSDNMTQLKNLNTSNSKILSDNILSLAINNATGELFIGTDKGLCSYTTEATLPSEEMNSDNVYAYPNPVTPDYTGEIMIVGLSNNADVKILSSNGSLIAEGRSTGGSFLWNGKDKNGNRVASGIYMVASATSEGKKGTVCKIAIVN